MPRVWARAAICAILAIAPAQGLARADDVHGVSLPRGTRAREGRHASGLGFRATVDHYAKRWRTDGIPVDAIGPYRVRGVDVMRFVRKDKAGEWLAVHVWRAGGVTWISVIPRPLDEPRSTE